MDSVNAVVVYKSLRNNLVNLPSSLVSMIFGADINVQDVICEFVWEGKRNSFNYGYCGWSGYTSRVSAAMTNVNKEYVEIDPIFASSLGLQDSSEITLNLKFNNYSVASTVELEPVSSFDWELVELNAGVLENNLLFQTRCIFENQSIIVYPSSTTSAKLKVLNFNPKTMGSQGNYKKSPAYAKIGDNTEFHIKPKINKKNEEDKKKSTRKSNGSIKSKASQHEIVPNVLFRGISMPHELFNINDPLHTENKFEVYVNFDECISKLQCAKYVYVSVIPGPGISPKTGWLKNSNSNDTGDINTSSSGNNASNNNSTNHNAELPVKESSKVVAKLVHYANAPDCHVGLSKILSISLGLEGSIGNLIKLESATSPLISKPKELIIHPYITKTEPSVKLQGIDIQKAGALDKKKDLKIQQQKLNEKLNEILKDSKIIDSNCLTNYCKLPILDDFVLPFGGILEFKKIRDGWCEPLNLKEVKIEIGENILKAESLIPGKLIYNQSADKDLLKEYEVVGQDKLINSIVRILKRGNIGASIYGNSGSGKTVIANTVSENMAKLGFYVKSINCESLATLNPTNLLKAFEDVIKEISWSSPSLLILENCDSIMPQELEHSDNSQTKQLSEFLNTQFLDKVMKRRKVSLLLTSKSKNSINSLLLSSHLIEEDFNLKSPDQELRKKILEYYLIKLDLKVAHKEMINDVSVDTEGYLPGDLKIFIDRAYHDLISEIIETEQDQQHEQEKLPLKIKKSNFSKALEGFTPSSLRGAKLAKSTVNWNEIGGLRKAKQLLSETLEWPTKYAPIFANCPLRLRSGILLYGYPGCGKTLLASAISSQCGLNFISIKGPEILNKYIGASEQSVRELFERASAAKPCILFFDEFDSIAPKRGHDSTGVTDRVVNQMLTQMDGAEGLDGVYVLAATSRPDLIDSALLRPGRLDKSVLCGLPDLEDRLDILSCITSKMVIDKSVDLNVIADATSGYSGADLQAVGYNAYLTAVHEKLENDEKLIIEVQKELNFSGNNKNKNLEFFQIGKGKNFKSSLQDLKPAEKLVIAKQLEHIFSNLSIDRQEDEMSQNSLISSNGQDKNNGVILKQEHLLKSLKDTKKSISENEALKLSKIYNQFLSPNERDGKMPDGLASTDIGGRTSLM
ncbi:hypothetical protein PACTADRAFT_74733 [Pachysolen tannophilus NRRL Y-2460]|uniref:Peroxisomal ATPase PEX1 n=1 Tax=Pachysolen tannophilus NRRL Y-2460 TaxID=669874 RepID=A0A1E4TZL1_PACTA|nr:hypothetical protein PACTADRAFT_74733 [Pachysolen tannophilus NRRL Y-2460]